MCGNERAFNVKKLRFSQYFLAFSFNIFKLATVYGPPQADQNGKHQHHRQRDEQIQNVHGRSPKFQVARTAFGVTAPGAGRDKRKALPTTSKELAAMPKPAAQAGNMPATASGTQTAL